MRRLLILTQKEFLQMWRDPSAFILAFIMPAVMILLFGFCVNLDSSVTRLALVAEDESPAMHRLIEYLEGSRNIEVLRTTSRPEAQQLLHTGAVHGMLVVPGHAAQQAERHEAPDLLMATDGSIPNTAQFTAMYLQSIYARWQAENGVGSKVDIRTNYRFNPVAESRWYIVPGAIAMVLAMVGTFLTSMVVAREWERGTIESILATSTTRVEFLISKLIPYFFMGLGAMLVCVIFARFVFAVPIHASLWAVFGVAALFLLSVLCMGLLISTAVRSQYSASLISLMVAMLPSMLLSGFVFELTSAPGFVQGVSYFIPARYFCSCLASLFLAGGHATILLFNVGMLAVSALFWFALVLLITPKRLDS